MALNTNIALGVQTPQFESPMKLALVANQLRESQMKAQEYEAAAQERNALRQLNPADTDYANQLMRVSPTQGIAYRKSLEEAKSAEATRLKSKTETFAAKRGIVSSMMRDLSARPDDENIKSHFRDVMESDLFTDQEKADLTTRTERLLAIPFEERKPFLASQGGTVADLRPQAVAPGGSLVQGGKVVYTAPEATDPEVKRYEYAKDKQGYKGTLFDFKREMAMAGRTPAQAPAPTITQVVDPSNPNQMITVDARRYQGGGVGSPGVIGVGGKEPGAALRTNKAEEGKTQLTDDLANLRASFDRLNEMRAIPSTQRSAASNIAASTQSSGVGQMLGRTTGTEAQVERDVINSAKQRLVTSIKNATGMSAQQLNSNMELQAMLRSLSDVSLGYEASLRIIDDIENTYVKGDGKLPKRDDKKPAAGANVVVTPDGQTHTFPTPAAAAQFKKAAGIP